MSLITIIISNLEGRKTRLTVSKKEKIKEGKRLFGQGDPQWKYDGETLNNEKTFEDYGIENDDVITSNERSRGGGGYFGISTIDVSKNKTKNLGFDKEAPDYRLVSYGLNIQSKCKNKNCKAYEDIIYIQFNYVTKWNLLENIDKVRCPVCNSRVKPINFGFFNCKYEIEYEKDEDDEIKSGTISGESGEKDFIVFDDYSSGKAIFIKLIFNISLKQ